MNGASTTREQRSPQAPPGPESIFSQITSALQSLRSEVALLRRDNSDLVNELASLRLQLERASAISSRLPAWVDVDVAARLLSWPTSRIKKLCAEGRSARGIMAIAPGDEFLLPGGIRARIHSNCRGTRRFSYQIQVATITSPVKGA